MIEPPKSRQELIELIAGSQDKARLWDAGQILRRLESHGVTFQPRKPTKAQSVAGVTELSARTESAANFTYARMTACSPYSKHSTYHE